MPVPQVRNRGHKSNLLPPFTAPMEGRIVTKWKYEKHENAKGKGIRYDNKRNNVWVVGRRDLENCNNPTGQTNYSKMIVKPSDNELSLHKQFLKNFLKKNYFN